MSKDNVGTALVSAAGSTGSTALIGSLEEKTKAFQQMAAAAAMGLFPAGYDTPNKVMSACWMADALGVHPGAYMNGVWPATMGNKTVLMPQWEFEHGLLKARLPGYKMTVIEKSEKAAEIEMSDGSGDVQRERFTIERAQQMKLTEKAGWMTNVVDHLFAKCFHRCAARIGAHVLGGLPGLAQAGDYQPEIVPAGSPAPPSGSGAEVLPDDVPATHTTASAGGITMTTDPRTLLSQEMARIYGPLPVKDRLAKLSLLLSAALREELPEGSQVPEFAFKSLGEIGPVDAERILKFTQKKWPAGAIPEEAKAIGKDGSALQPAASPAVDTGREAESREASNPSDEAPPVEEPYIEPPAQRTGEVDWTEFVSLVTQAKREGREFIKEAPKGSRRWWFVDKPILDQRGVSSAVCLYKDDAVQESLGWYADRLRELLPKEMR